MTFEPRKDERLWRAMYSLALVISVALWFIAIRAPLWLDETISYFTIKAGAAKILSRQGWPGIPAYPFLLWLWTRATGTGEVSMRLLSVAAMLGAVFFLYRAARELFDWDVAMIAAVLFCLHQNTVFSAIDIRPYPFAALAINACIYTLVRMRRLSHPWLAALFGVLAAMILYFQFLFAVILLPLCLCLLLLNAGDRKTRLTRTAIAAGAFVVAILPVLPGAWYLFHSTGAHVFAEPPEWLMLRNALVHPRLGYPLLALAALAIFTRRLDLRSRWQGWPVLLCLSLALLPIFTLFVISLKTPVHIFVFRYRLLAAPGAALLWALLVSRVTSHALRLMFCLGVVAVSSVVYLYAPDSKTHDYTWKEALEVADRNASADNAPVIICSDLPESDSMPLPPAGEAPKDNILFAPLSYYPFHAPVVPLPRSLNDVARRAGSAFVRDAAVHHQRFLAMGFMPSWDTLEWLTEVSDATHSEREIGTYNGITVMEFLANPVPAASSAPSLPSLTR